MTSTVRGRGFVNRDRRDAREQLRRPLESPTSGTKQWESPFDLLSMKISSLDTDDAKQLEEVNLEITTYCTSTDKLKLLIDDIHERSLVNRKFGILASAALATVGLLQVDDVKLRAVLIKNLQNDFTSSEMTRSGNKPRFLNSVAFLGEIFHRVKLANDCPIAVLAGAHVAYQKQLLQGEENELELCINLLALNGRQLVKCNPALVEDLIITINSMIVTADMDSRSRAWLLLAVHMDKHLYRSLPDNYRQLFENMLGKDAISHIVKQLALLEVQDIVQEKGVESLTDLKLAIQSVGAMVPSAQESRTGVVKDTAQPSGVVANPVKQSNPVLGNGSDFKPRQPRNYKEDLPEKVMHEGYGDGIYNRRNDKNSARQSANQPDGGGDRKNVNKPRTGQYRDANSDSKNWLPRPERTEEDCKIWGLGTSGGRESGHDDRCERGDYYSKGAEKERNSAARQPLPDDDNWGD